MLMQERGANVTNVFLTYLEATPAAILSPLLHVGDATCVCHRR